MFVLKVRGDSCDYYVGPRGTGVLSPRDALLFPSEAGARVAMASLRARGVVNSPWEVVRAEKLVPTLAS